MGDLFQNFDLTSCKRFFIPSPVTCVLWFRGNWKLMYCWKKIINNATNQGWKCYNYKSQLARRIFKAAVRSIRLIIIETAKSVSANILALMCYLNFVDWCIVFYMWFIYLTVSC